MNVKSQVTYTISSLVSQYMYEKKQLNSLPTKTAQRRSSESTRKPRGAPALLYLSFVFPLSMHGAGGAFQLAG